MFVVLSQHLNAVEDYRGVKLGWEYSTVVEHLHISLSTSKGKETQGVILQTVSPRESSIPPPKPQGCLSETHVQKSPDGHTKQVSLE